MTKYFIEKSKINDLMIKKFHWHSGGCIFMAVELSTKSPTRACVTAKLGDVRDFWSPVKPFFFVFGSSTAAALAPMAADISSCRRETDRAIHRQTFETEIWSHIWKMRDSWSSSNDLTPRFPRVFFQTTLILTIGTCLDTTYATYETHERTPIKYSLDLTISLRWPYVAGHTANA